MGSNRSQARRRRSGPPETAVDLDALPPVFKVVTSSERVVDLPVNATARRLELGDPVRRALCRLGSTAASSRRWQSECLIMGAVSWLAIVAPAPLGAQVVLLPVSVDADPGRLDDVAPGLTPREREVLTLSLRGGSPRDISAQLGISWHTVRTHLKHAYRALGVSGRAEAVTVVVESARPKVHLRMITDDAEATSGRHSRPSSRSHPAPVSSRHSRPASKAHASPVSGRHSRPPSRTHAKPTPSRPPSRTHGRPSRGPSRPPSRPR